MGKISADGFDRRFALACRPQGTWKDEINRLFAEQQINPRTFCDDTELDETMYYRLKSKDEPPALATVISLCVGLSLDTLTAYHLIALAGYTLLPGNTLHRLYAYFIENSEDLTVWECSEFLRSMGYCRKGELLGSQQRI